ncbi:DUF4123 domain-containing protein [Aestuariibius sp. 2305UL40-4]|uniref:DUF4123 domain-containing protein n=1 Tax=Aestuariibius violaceus TaxID=3234132 RepID=UPI00345E469E
MTSVSVAEDSFPYLTIAHVPIGDPEGEGILSKITIEDTADLQTFLLLDPALYERVNGSFANSDLDLPYKPLLNGPQARELADVAPVLLRFANTAIGESRSDFEITFLGRRDLLRTGVIFRAATGLDEMAAHLRRFVRLRDEAGRWSWFRLADPSVMSAYIPRSVGRRADRAAAWLQDASGTKLQSIIMLPEATAKTLIVATVRQDALPEKRAPAALDEDDRRIFVATQQERFRAAFLAEMAARQPVRMRGLKEEHRQAFGQHSLNAALDCGITAPGEVAYFGHLMLYLGALWYRDPLHRWLNQELTGERSPADRRMTTISHRFRSAAHDVFGMQMEKSAAMLSETLDALGALIAAHQVTPDQVLLRLQSISAPRFGDRIQPDDVKAHAQIAIARAGDRYGVSTERDRGLYLGLSLCFGLGFDRDPLTPWIGETLKADQGTISERLDAVLTHARKRGEKLLRLHEAALEGSNV